MLLKHLVALLRSLPLMEASVSLSSDTAPTKSCTAKITKLRSQDFHSVSATLTLSPRHGLVLYCKNNKDGRCGRGSHLLPEWESMEQDANSCFEETLLGIKLAQLRMRQGMSRNTGHIGKSWQIQHEIQIKLLSSLQLSSFFGSMMNPQGLQADRNPGKLHLYEQEP